MQNLDRWTKARTQMEDINYVIEAFRHMTSSGPDYDVLCVIAFFKHQVKYCEMKTYIKKSVMSASVAKKMHH